MNSRLTWAAQRCINRMRRLQVVSATGRIYWPLFDYAGIPEVYAPALDAAKWARDHA
jgi:hypothetical protein